MQTEVAKTIAKAIAKVRAFAVEHDFAKSGLARRAGLSINALRDLHSPNWNPEWETLNKLLIAIDAMEREQKRRSKRQDQQLVA